MCPRVNQVRSLQAIFASFSRINGATLDNVGQHFCLRRGVRRPSFQQLSFVSQRCLHAYPFRAIFASVSRITLEQR